MLRKISEVSSTHTMLLLTIFLLYSLQGYWCATDVQMRVTPSPILVGENVTINCTYTLESETMVQLRYYLNNTQFYSYIPTDKIPIRVNIFFRVQSVVTENNGVLKLGGLDTDATGRYKCEVTTDSSTDPFVNSTSLVVVKVPESPPNITTQSPSFQVGKELNATCTSRGGSPLAKLTWFVNGVQVSYSDMHDVGDSSISELTLPHVSKPPNGQLHLRCEASQFTLYNASTEVVLTEASSSSGVLLIPFSGRVGSVAVSATLAAAAMSIHHRSF